MKPTKICIGRLLGATALSGAFAVTWGQPALAQQAASNASGAPAPPSAAVSEVVVTASRRAQDVTQIPYNITAVSSEQIQRTGVSTIEDLSQQVPNLVVTSSGRQFLGAQRQIMRGLNASGADRNGVTLEQNPVSTYLGNAPFANFFQIEDIARVEVLRGPQGTLYGAGALGGAIRLIPTEPVLGRYEGRLSAAAGVVSHSSDQDYDVKALVNIPLGDTLALRVGGAYEYNAGYIDQFGIWKRVDDNPIGLPILSNPSSPLTSTPVSYNAKDVNSSKGTDWRAALRWKPIDAFEMTLAYNVSRSHGSGPSYDTPAYHGGPDGLQPSVIYPATGEYQLVQRTMSPFTRTSKMTTLDASYDLGFATVSSTSSYFTTDGHTFTDVTTGVLAVPPNILAYYAGDPVNPRFNAVQGYDDSNRAYTQEVRLVSKGEGPIDYVVGLFYQKEKNSAFWTGFAPGQTAYDATPGVFSLPPGPNDQIWDVGGTNNFTDKAIFGELTWHILENLEVTGGVRTFQQTLTRDVTDKLFVFGINEVSSNSAKFKDTKFRFNAVYRYAAGHRAYFTFSQGFRRGGANAFSLSGPLREPASLLDYKPDSVDNYEVGLKGRLANGWLYTADVFDAKWHDPQIGGSTAINFWPVVFNGKEADSKGLELELSGDLTSELNFSAGYAYTDAKLTENFCLPSANGSGDPSTDLPCAIAGLKGQVLPSAPKHSATATLNYEHPLDDENTITATLNANYKSATWQDLPTVGARNPLNPSYWLVNAYAGWRHGPVTAALYARNLLDKRAVYSTNTRITAFAPIDLYQTVSHPRSVGLELRYDW